VSFAKVVLSGTVTSEPEKRFTPNNHAVTSFYLSVETLGMGNRQGNNEPFTVKITCWRNLAEAVTTQLQKGDSILVEGKLLINSFQTQEGVQKKLFEIEANTIDKLPGRPEPIFVPAGAASEEGGASGGGYNASARTATPAYAGSSYATPPRPTSGTEPSGHFSSEDLLTEDDIPF
jgi:single-strand DNA-binding protein